TSSAERAVPGWSTRRASVLSLCWLMAAASPEICFQSICEAVASENFLTRFLPISEEGFEPLVCQRMGGKALQHGRWHGGDIRTRKGCFLHMVRIANRCGENL